MMVVKGSSFCSKHASDASMWTTEPLSETCVLVSVPDTASYIRGWMQMVLTPNDLFSWNNKYSKYTVTLLHLHYNESILYSSAMHVNTHSVHAGDLEPWRGRLLPSSLALSSSTVSHVFSPTMSVANWRSLSLLGGFPPPPLPIWRPHPQGPHTPLP